MTPQPVEWTMTGFPPPPTANRRLMAGHVLSKEHRSWRDEFGWRARIAKAPRFPGTVSVEVILHEGKLDADNALKAMLDALKTHYVIVDDSPKYVRQVTVRYADYRDSTVRCMVVVRKYSTPSLSPQARGAA